MGLASVPLDTEGARRLLQQRVALFAKVAIGIGLIIQILLRVVGTAVVGATMGLDARTVADVHLGVLGILGVAWWRLRSGRRGILELELWDIVTVTAPIGFSLVLLWNADLLLRPDFLQLLGLTNILVLRAVLVPSSGRRTMVIGVVFGAVLAAWSYGYFSRMPAANLGTPALHALAMSLWCTITLVISTLASETIFGLRQRVRETAQLGQYTLLRRLGEGGMGVVYEARHALLRRRTALKVLPPDKTGEQSVARFEREVQLTAKLTHPNTISIYDYGRSPSGVFYYVMEYLDGADLQALVGRAGRQPPELVARVLEQVGNALAEAHEVGLIHRDIKPANIILCRRGGVPCVAKVVDFGLVRSVAPTTGDVAQSVADVIVGTPLYMSPESIANPAAVDARSDLYSVGAMGYFLLTGEAPFRGETAVEIAAHHLHTVPEPPSERLRFPVDPKLERILLSCLEKDPGRRPPNAAALSASLRETDSWRAFSTEVAERVWKLCSDVAAARERGAAEPVSPNAGTERILTVELGAARASGPAGSGPAA